jgi:two-component system, cell cycle response regulator CtrA
MRILIIEDDKLVRETLDLTLSREGFICDFISNADDGGDIITCYGRSEYDIIILDLMFPDHSCDGYEVLLRLRAAKVKIPVLILSGLSSVDQKIKGLGLGADDYLTKPFNREELIARINAIVRRSRGHSESVVRFDNGKVAINLDTRVVEVNGTPVHLTNKEYAILELLAMRRGSVLTKEMFLNHLYGSSMDEPEMKIIDVFICKLRKKLSDASAEEGGKDYIETVWGRGYMLKDYEQVENQEDLTTQQA